MGKIGKPKFRKIQENKYERGAEENDITRKQ